MIILPTQASPAILPTLVSNSKSLPSTGVEPVTPVSLSMAPSHTQGALPSPHSCNEKKATCSFLDRYNQITQKGLLDTSASAWNMSVQWFHHLSTLISLQMSKWSRFMWFFYSLPSLYDQVYATCLLGDNEWFQLFYSDFIQTMGTRAAVCSSHIHHKEGLIHAASCSGQLDILHRLIQDGANVTDPERHGFSSLHLATMRGHVDALKLLSTSPTFSPHVLASSHINLLHTALLFKSHVMNEQGQETIDLVDLLLSWGIDVTQCDDDGNTPLHYALQQGLALNTRLLLKHGAHPYIPNHQGESPYDIAVKKKYIEFIRYLDRYYPRSSFDLFVSSKQRLSRRKKDSGFW